MKRGASETSASAAATRGETARPGGAFGLEWLLPVLAGLATSLLAASLAQAIAPASHDVGLVRAVGLGWAGPFRALDALVTAPLMLLPLGTRALRAGLASALVGGACAAVACSLSLSLVRSTLPRLFSRGGRPVSSALVLAVSGVATLAATLAPAFQREASAPGGAVTGALLILAAMELAPRAERHPSGLALVLGLAASHHPLVLASAALAALPWALGWAPRLVRDRGAMLHAGASFVLGLAPLLFAVAVASRAPEIALPDPLGFALPAPGAVLAFATREVGVLVLAAAAAGTALVAWRGEARRALAAALLVVAVGALSLGEGRAPLAPPVLAALVAVHALAAVALAAAVVAIARARVPFAHASASLVVVLELVLPVRAIDETLARRETRPVRAPAVWTDAAFGELPPASVLLVSERTTARRIAAARATGDMRGDVVVVPVFEPNGPVARRALAAEPSLVAILRDVALGSPPEELSLAKVAAQRPLVTTFDPRWDRRLARHLMPVGLTSQYEPEPRGPTDRRAALEAFAPSKARLLRVTVARPDPVLAEATAALLRARAIGMAATGDREILSRSLDDLRPFAPGDPTADTLVRRLLTTKGAIEVGDLGEGGR
jgi:hypothetical protein